MSSLFGSKPSVPTLPVVSLDNSQQQAIKANQAAEPGVAQIAGFTEQQILGMMRNIIPNFDEITSTAGSNIASELKGQLPQDVSDAVQNSAASRSLGSGTAGSGLGRDLVARDLGLTSLSLTDKGLSSAESWMGAAERMMAPAVQDLSSMFITPMQEYTTTNEQNVQQFQRKWLANQISAMPDPTIRGIQDTVMQLSGRGNGYQTPNYGAMGGVGAQKDAAAQYSNGDFGDWSNYGDQPQINNEYLDNIDGPNAGGLGGAGVSSGFDFSPSIDVGAIA